MPIVFFITHPDVAIDRRVPIPDWPLNERGRARIRVILDQHWVRNIHSVFSSDERKARDGAEILADGLGLASFSIVRSLGENDRSATGFLGPDEFEATVNAFFEQPQTSVRGWEPAADAQARIIRAVEQVIAQAPLTGDVAIVGHGGTGTLLYCHLARVPISGRYDQPRTNGGNWSSFDRLSRKLLHTGWQSIDAPSHNA
jgi:broad specificity phosphatase PhoE